jgi:hypothetical protein
MPSTRLPWTDCDKVENTSEPQRELWKHVGTQGSSLGAPVNSLGALATRPGARMSILVALMASLDAPGSTCNEPKSTSNHWKVVWENDIFFRKIAGMPGNYSYYLLFNDF